MCREGLQPAFSARRRSIWTDFLATNERAITLFGCILVTALFLLGAVMP